MENRNASDTIISISETTVIATRSDDDQRIYSYSWTSTRELGKRGSYILAMALPPFL
jgi:hypothetical protein